VSYSSAARRSLLENEEVVSYLDELDALEDFSPERPNRTDTPEFRAEVVALGQGLLDSGFNGEEDETADRPPLLLMSPQFDPDNVPDEIFEPDVPGSSRSSLPPFSTALFLLGMSLLGASSAAAVFHDRLFRILGW